MSDEPRDLTAVLLAIGELKGAHSGVDHRIGELSATLNFSLVQVSKEIQSHEVQDNERYKELKDKIHGSQLKVAAIFGAGVATTALLGALIAILLHFVSPKNNTTANGGAAKSTQSEK